MKRANLKQEFHGEPDMAEEGTDVSGEGPDEVTIDIARGTLTLRVPSSISDDHVLDAQYLEQFLQLVLELEDGSELTLILDEERDGVDIRRETSDQIRRESKSESQLEAEKSPRAESNREQLP